MAEVSEIDAQEKFISFFKVGVLTLANVFSSRSTGRGVISCNLPMEGGW
jgi:hypothetical protein